MSIIVYCDGGCSNNQNPSKREAYGSYVVLKDGKEIKYEFLNFKNETNNEAEYLALEASLNYLETIDIDDKVIIRTDSQLIEGHLVKDWKITPSLIKYVRPIKNQLSKIGMWHIEKISGVEMKQILGH